jgi:uncharacterized delta-60 repeat protein
MRSLRFAAGCGLLLAALNFIVIAQTCPGSSGCLDPTFNYSGKQFIPTPNRTHQASGVIQSNGQIVSLVDNSVTGATLIRLDPDGSLDTTFGTNGIVYTNWHFSTTFPRGYPYDVAIQNIDGEERLVVVGSWTVPAAKKNTYSNNLRIDRYLSNGAPDTDFGTNGTLVVNNPAAMAVDIDYAGRIVAVGDSGAVTRRLPDGSLDPSFGPNGAGVTGAGGPSWDVKALPDGSLLFAGSCTSGGETVMCAMKLKENGAADESFGNVGRAFANFNSIGAGALSRAFSLDVDTEGNIVVAGTNGTASKRGATPIFYFAAARFTPTGSLDPGFNTTGKVTSSVSGMAKSVHWMPGGGFIMTGSAKGPLNTDFFLTSYTATGTLDSNFGNSGLIFTDINSGDYSQKSLLWIDPLCSCNKLLVFGNSDGSAYGASFARYLLY